MIIDILQLKSNVDFWTAFNTLSVKICLWASHLCSSSVESYDRLKVVFFLILINWDKLNAASILIYAKVSGELVKIQIMIPLCKVGPDGLLSNKLLGYVDDTNPYIWTWVNFILPCYMMSKYQFTQDRV